MSQTDSNRFPLSDGLAETRRSDGSLFGAERTLAVVRAHQQESAYKIVDALYRAVREFAGERPQEDDITETVIKVGE